MTLRYLLFIAAALLLFTACADAIPIDACVTEEPSGFLHGLWHGFIAPLSFIVSIFDDEVAIYAINNNGVWYDFGFMIGAGILFSAGGKAGS